jgi:hypothetical protein
MEVKMSTYAGIGSRALTQDEWNFCYNTGVYLANLGWMLKTGAADGADKAFAEGALHAGGKVTLCLPWWSYNKEWVQAAKNKGALTHTLKNSDTDAFQSVEKHHPCPSILTRGPRALHARNFLIIQETKMVLAWPKPKGQNLGGTGQGIRIAEDMGIEVIRLDLPEGNQRVARQI